MPTKAPKVLIYDIETSPNLAYVWTHYEANVLGYDKQWELLCFAYKWLGEKTIHCLDREGKKTDEQLVKSLWELFDEADVVVAHNGNSFDQKKAQARMIELGLKPPRPYKSIDTKLVARRYFKFNSNKLNDLGKTLKLGEKIQTGGFELWMGCLRDEPAAWAKMKRYNKQDVALLEKVYLKFRPWIEGHPNLAAIAGRPDGCPKCGHTKLHSIGVRTTKTRSQARFRCVACGGVCWGNKSKEFATVQN